MVRAVHGPASPDDQSTLETVRDVEGLVDGLEERAGELRLDAGNANQVLSFALVVFLSSESGREFGESLRFCTYERLRIASEHSEALQEELRAAEERAQAAGRVFSFVEELTSRLNH